MHINQMTGFSSCEDITGDFSFFQAWLGDVSITNCADLEPYCGIQNFIGVHLQCPFTCGCNDPRSGLLFFDGCPQACFQDERWVDSDCQDPTPGVLAKDPGWKRWWKAWLAGVDATAESG